MCLKGLKKFYLVIIVIGDHNKEFTREALRSTLWDEHVLWPSTATEVEGL